MTEQIITDAELDAAMALDTPDGGNGSRSMPLERAYHSDPRQGDRPKNKERVLVKVRLCDDHGVTVFAGNLITPGHEHFVVMYVDEFARLRASVRTDIDRQVIEHAKNLEEMRFGDWCDAHGVTDRIKEIDQRAKQHPEASAQLAIERTQVLTQAKRQTNVHWALYLIEAAAFLRAPRARYRSGAGGVYEYAEVVERLGSPIAQDKVVEHEAKQSTSELARAIEGGFANLFAMFKPGPYAKSEAEQKAAFEEAMEAERVKIREEERAKARAELGGEKSSKNR